MRKGYFFNASISNKASSTPIRPCASSVAAPICGVNDILGCFNISSRGGLVVKHVQCSKRNFPAVERCDKFLLVDNTAAGSVDQSHTVFEKCKLFFADHRLV